MGGRVGLKGTDGVVEQAQAAGAEPVAGDRARAFAEPCLRFSGEDPALDVDWLAGGDRMGEIRLRSAGIPGSRIDVVHKPLPTTTAGDTVHTVENTIARGADLILFCGGDGTARDVASAVQDRVPILGIPAGVKMHSGLFAVSPSAAARLLAAFMRSELRIGAAEILDLDEDAYRKGEWRVRFFATAKTPVGPPPLSAGGKKGAKNNAGSGGAASTP